MSEEDKQEERLPRKEFLVFGKPDLHQPEIDEVVATLESGWIGTGPRVAQFESEFCNYTGSKHAVAVSSCTAALHLSLLEYGIGPGDEVITSPMTFASTANVIVLVGATPVFVDIDEDTQNIDPALIQSAVTPRTKAIIPVHYVGRSCNMTSILEIAQRHGLVVIEDAAHPPGAQYEGHNIRTIGDLPAPASIGPRAEEFCGIAVRRSEITPVAFKFILYENSSENLSFWLRISQFTNNIG